MKLPPMVVESVAALLIAVLTGFVLNAAFDVAPGMGFVIGLPVGVFAVLMFYVPARDKRRRAKARP